MLMTQLSNPRPPAQQIDRQVVIRHFVEVKLPLFFINQGIKDMCACINIDIAQRESEYFCHV